MQYLFILSKSIPISFAALMPVINPIGTAIILLSLTEGITEEKRRGLAKRVAFNTILLLTGLLLGGSYLLSFFGITVPIVQTAGGLVLASMGWKLLNQNEENLSTGKDGTQEDSKFYEAKTFYPFTFPITVGPGGVAVTLTLSAHTTHGNWEDTVVGQAGAFIGIVGIGIIVYLCFAYSNRLAARLGASGTLVLMRLIAFIVICIGAEISWEGIRTLISQLPSRS